MTDRSLQNAIAAMCIAMVSIVAASWTIYLVTPQKVAPSPATLSV